MKTVKILSLSIVLISIIHYGLNAKTIFVDANTQANPINQTGNNWSVAFENLQDAILVLQSGDQIWIAEGNYRPDLSHFNNSIQQGDPFACFLFRNLNNISIYGGFSPSNGITSFNQRNIDLYPVILDGMMNSLIVFRMGNCSNAIIGGISFKRSQYDNFNQCSTILIEGSMNITLEDCCISDNISGSPLYSENSSITLLGCNFIDNIGSEAGCCLFYHPLDILTEGCKFINNHGRGVKKKSTSQIFMAGSICIINPLSDVMIKNSVFYLNSSQCRAGALMFYLDNTNIDAYIQNCTITSNSTDAGDLGSAIDIDCVGTSNNCAVFIRNSILKNSDTYIEEIRINPCIINVQVDYSSVKNGWNGLGSNNIPKDPLFTSDYHLSRVSPCINAGNLNYTNLGLFDIDNEPRVSGESVDIGADEYVDDLPSEIIYVNQAHTGPENGHSWATAYNDLQEALDIASPNNEIWVAEGTYKPSTSAKNFPMAEKIILPNDPRSNVFEIGEGFSIYGGFNGTETLREQRDWVTNPTILSGELNNSLDCYFLLLVYCVNIPSIIDGFQIVKTNGQGLNSYTSAICMPINNTCFYLRNSLVHNHNNSGIHRVGGSCGSVSGMLNVTNCIISNNYEGGTWIAGATNCNDYQQELISFTDCSFIENGHFSLYPTKGGGVYIGLGLKAEFTNCVFSENIANNGGAIYCEGQSNGTFLPETDLIIKNSSFSNNRCTNLGQTVYMTHPMYASIINSILWSDGTFEEIYKGQGAEFVIRYSNILGGFKGTGNINSDPKFYNPLYHDLHLKSTGGRFNIIDNTWIDDLECSPCIDAGGDYSYKNEPSPNGNRVNMGAFGNTQEASKSCIELTPKDSLLSDSTNILINVIEKKYTCSLYPNPFKDILTIKVEGFRGKYINISIFNINGNLVRCLFEGTLNDQSEKKIIWDGIGESNQDLLPGVYYIIILNNETRQITKVIKL